MLRCYNPVDYLTIPNIGYPNSPVPRLEYVVLIQRIFRGWEMRRPIPSLVMLSVNQVAHLMNEDVMKFAPLHVNLIPNMGINKRKQDKGSGVKPPPLIHTQKKAMGSV